MSLIPEDLTANGNPFRQPRAFEVDGVEAALYPAIATGSDIAVGKLVQVRADQSAVLADASDDIEANGICVRVLDGGKIVWSHDAMLWLAVAGAASSGLQRLFLGESGTLAASPPSGGLVQRIGSAIQYNGTTGKHRCRILPKPGAALL